MVTEFTKGYASRDETLWCSECSEMIGSCDNCSTEFSEDDDVYCAGEEADNHLCITCYEEQKGLESDG